jgi:PKD repeat protein/photosystem II stability/assembly factor-like uncharacterized protein
MKHGYRFLIPVLALVFMAGSLSAQNWVDLMKDPDANFYDVQKSFNRYYVKKERQIERQKRQAARRNDEGVSDEELEVPGFAQYKRWEWFMSPRVALDGKRFDPSLTWRENTRYQQQNGLTAAGNWTLIGPTNVVPTNGGAGRLNFVRFDPNSPSTIYVGSPAGGLWKSTNGGSSWSTNTDKLSQVIGCTDLAIDPTNTNIMYLATGDGDAGDTYTVGVLKSTDGGATWNPTGLSFYMANTRQMSRILLNPTSTNILLVATSAGIFRSDDAGATFTLVQAGAFKDMEYKPGDPNTVYACGTEFYRSTNGGQTWTKVTGGFTAAANLSRMAIAVTPADPAYVYVLAAKAATDYGFEGIYKSTNSGSTFAKVNTTQPSNILGWVSAGNDVGGQGWYDLAFAASPTNRDEIMTGGVNIWKSTNGGATFFLNAHWTGSGAPYVHADVHDLVYVDGSTVYSGCDGGIFKSSNGNWSDLSDGLQIGQMYGFGQSDADPSLLIQGWQDNGTNLYDGVNWNRVIGGDGMLCFIDRTNDQIMYGSLYYGDLNRSTNGGNSWSNATGNISETGPWVTPWSQDPVDPSVIYAGFVNMWKTNNGGTNWTQISNFSGASTINTFAVSPANNQIIWVSRAGGLQRSANGGATWSTISNVPPGTISGITCSDTDPNKVWITYSGFNNSNKVFHSNDQGATWINMSGSIPNIPVNCIVRMNNSADALYIGTDVGVFYKDTTLSVWQPFGNGLPNVIVTQLRVFYPDGKLRASTYGRGMWESDLYVAGSYPPVSTFGTPQTISCPGAAVQFSDYSAGQPNSWTWSFPGGNPSASTQQNPLVYYNTPGTYPVSLITTNANGSDTATYANYIQIASSSQPDPTATGASFCAPGSATVNASGSGTGTLRWWDAPGGGNLLATGSSYTGTFSGTTTLYVDEELPAGQTDFAGEAGTSIGAGALFTANDIRGLYFDVINPVVLNTVEVYSGSAGNRTIEIIDGQGNTYADTTVFIPASPNSPVTVPLNFTLYPGTNYFIKCRGLVDLYRNSSGATYPYISSSINVTGSNAGSPGYYYFFYFWNYTEVSCNTGRTVVTVTDTCEITGINEAGALSNLSISPNPNNGLFILSFESKTKDNSRITINNMLGQVVYEETIGTYTGRFNREFDLRNLGKGMYLLNIQSGNSLLSRKITID